MAGRRYWCLDCKVERDEDSVCMEEHAFCSLKRARNDEVKAELETLERSMAALRLLLDGLLSLELAAGFERCVDQCTQAQQRQQDVLQRVNGNLEGRGAGWTEVKDAAARAAAECAEKLPSLEKDLQLLGTWSEGTCTLRFTLDQDDPGLDGQGQVLGADSGTGGLAIWTTAVRMGADADSEAQRVLKYLLFLLRREGKLNEDLLNGDLQPAAASIRMNSNGLLPGSRGEGDGSRRRDCNGASASGNAAATTATTSATGNAAEQQRHLGAIPKRTQQTGDSGGRTEEAVEEISDDSWDDEYEDGNDDAVMFENTREEDQPGIPQPSQSPQAPAAPLAPLGPRTPRTPEPPQPSQEEMAQLQEKKRERESAQINYELLLDLDSHDLIPNLEAFECSICMNIFVEPCEGVVLRECCHTFCKDCLTNTVQHSEEAEVKCPFGDEDYACGGLLLEREIKALVPEAVYERHLIKSIALAENRMSDTFHCKTPDCRGFCVFEDDVNEFPCPVCGSVNCLTCQVIHAGMTCTQYQDRIKTDARTSEDARQTQAQLEAMLASREAMKCPSCGVILMKKAGCDYLRCSMCRTEICWVTRQARWGPRGHGDSSGGCGCRVNGRRCHPQCGNCH